MLRKLVIITFLFFPVVPVFAQENRSTGNSKTDHKAIGSPMPSFNITTQQGKKLTETDFSGKANLFIVTFNPTCDHCQEMAMILERNIKLFKRSKIVFITGADNLSRLEFFENVTNISQYKPITAGADSAGFIDKTYMYEYLPQINIYDKDRKLLKVMWGDIPIDSLKPYIQ